MVKPIPSKPPDSARYCGVDPDDLALKIQEGAAAIARIDWRIGLQKVLVCFGSEMFVRCFALMIPWVTDLSRARGAPIATTHSPTSSASESPKVRRGSGFPAEISDHREVGF